MLLINYVFIWYNFFSLVYFTFFFFLTNLSKNTAEPWKGEYVYYIYVYLFM